MLDPLNALSVASNVVQIVDTGSRLIGTAIATYRSSEGAVDDNLHVEAITEDLRDACQAMSQSVRTLSQESSEHEQKLSELAGTCFEVATELIAMLDDLKITGKRYRSWQALRQTIRSSLKADKVRQLEVKLSTLRSEISLRLSSIIRDEQSSVRLALADIAGDARKDHHDITVRLETMRTELLEALRRQYDQSLVQSEDGQELSSYQQSCKDVALKLKRLRLDANSITNAPALLMNLSYEGMRDRQINMRKAYGETYAWIFDSQATPFRSWLEQGDGTFWIGGKAGSGKSTLMESIDRSPHKLAALKSWAGSRTIVTASFYFWNSASFMARSARGFLQSLLYDTFRQCPELIGPAVSERRKKQAQDGLLEPWSQVELWEALRTAIFVGRARDICFFFLFDGLDEYTGECYELINDLDVLASATNVKLCVSSRPWNIFLESYGDCDTSHLMLHEYTKPDREQYITGFLVENSRFSRKAARDPRGYYELVDEIRQRAQGVFFWVFLVVRSLLRGLSEGDDIQMLRHRLRALPSDLEDYFRHMLACVDEAYRDHTARALQITTVSAESLPVILYAFLEDDTNDPDSALDAEVRALSQDELELEYSKGKLLINKWCRDLLQVDQMKVDYLHRTVKDFLAQAEIQSELRRQSADSFTPESALCRLYLRLAKGAAPGLQPAGNQDPFQRHGKRPFFEIAENVLEWARQCETLYETPQTTVLLDLEEAGESVNKEWTHAILIGKSVKPDSPHLNFVVVAAFFNLHHFIEHQYLQRPDECKRVEEHMLRACLQRRRPGYRSPIAAETSKHASSHGMIDLLLRLGFDPHEGWPIFLECCTYRGINRLQDLPRTAELFFQRRVLLDCDCDTETLQWVKQTLVEACEPKQLLQLEAIFSRAVKVATSAMEPAPDVGLAVPDAIRIAELRATQASESTIGTRGAFTQHTSAAVSPVKSSLSC